MGYELSFAGLIISLLFIALTGIYPGGIIVPGYLVLFAGEPLRIAGTLIVAVVTVLLYRTASRYLLLFGRRRFVFMLLTAGLLTFTVLRLLPVLFPASIEFRVIGWVVPGLIANNCERQGVLITAGAMLTVTVVLYALGRLYYGFF